MSERVKKWNLDKWEWHKAKHDDGRNNGSVVTTRGVCICKAPQYETEAQWVAHAQLLRAAPALVEALEAAIDCGMVPISSAKDGGASRHSRQVQVADQIRAALAMAYGETQ